jgi:hypothetical protein
MSMFVPQLAQHPPTSVKWEVFIVVKDQSSTVLNTPNVLKHPPHFTGACTTNHMCHTLPHASMMT